MNNPQNTVKNQKTALIIGMNPDYCIGGTEFYNSNLIRILLKNGFKIDYFSYNFDLNNPRIRDLYPEVNYLNSINTLSTWEENNFLFRIIKSKSKITKLLKGKEYTIIIDSNVNSWQSEPKLDNRIFVQQFNAGFYDLDFIIGKKFSKLFQFLAYLFLKRINPILKSNYHVFFTEEDLKDFKSRCNILNFSQALIQPIAYNDMKFENISVEKNKRILYLGRLENHQKNIKKILKISKKLDFIIDVYGEGAYKKQVIESKCVNYMGIFKNSNKQLLYKSYLATILLSKYEGFPNVLVESLTSGTPIIVLDSFPSARFLTDDGNNGLLIDSKWSLKKTSNKINEFLNDSSLVQEKSLNCLKFAEKHLSSDEFEKRWIEYINKIVANRLPRKSQ